MSILLDLLAFVLKFVGELLIQRLEKKANEPDKILVDDTIRPPEYESVTENVESKLKKLM